MSRRSDVKMRKRVMVPAIAIGAAAFLGTLPQLIRYAKMKRM